MELTDPSDWPGSMPDLRTIDNLLRCSICFEYLNVAMIIPACSHNYCSLCIRRYMKYKRQCPSCNIEVGASELCNNRTLDELVKTFVAVRPHILKLCKQAETSQGGCSSSDDDQRPTTQRAKPAQTQVSVTKQSPKKLPSTLKGHFKSSKSPPFSTKEPQNSCSDDVLNRSNEENISPKSQPPFRNRGRKGERPSVQTAAEGTGGSFSSSDSDDVIEIDGDGEIDQAMASTSCSLVLSKATPSGNQATPGGSQATLSGSQATPSGSQATPGGSQATPGGSQATPGGSQATPGGSQATPGGSQATPGGSQATPGGSRDKAECPVCGVPVTTKYINSHLDACLKRTEQAQTTKRVPKRKRIPGMVWKLVSDKEIKKKMKEYHLSIRGKRHELIKRLDEFILMYNAQCDAANPKSVEEIAKEVERMEQLKTQPQQLKEAQVHKLKIEKGFTEQQIQQSKQEYLLAHKDQFSKLVAEARERMTAAKRKSQKNKECPSSETSSSQDSASIKTSASTQEDGPTKDTSTSKDSTLIEIDEVVVLEENDSKSQVPEQHDEKRLPTEDEGRTDSDKLCQDPPTEAASSEISSKFCEEPNTAIHNRPAESSLLAGFSGSDAQQELGSKVLAPSSPSVASRDGNENGQSQQLSETVENFSKSSNLGSDPAPELQEPLCIPESPLSVVAETRRRKRKKQDWSSNASDSGSSYGDGETTLRRSKRERKTIK